MGVQRIMPVKVLATVSTMLNSDDDFDEHGVGDVTCKQT